MRRRIGAGAVVSAALAVSLAACGQPAAPPEKPPPGTSKPTPATSDVLSLHDLLFELKARYNVDYPLGDACPDGVAYNDVNCGQQLAGLNQVGQALAKAVSELDAKAPGAKKLLDAADTLNRSFTDVQGLGCYGLGTQPPKQSPDTLESLCPELGKVAMVTYLDLETNTDNQ